MKAFLNFLVGDFYIAIPMLLMSLAGLALVIWRLLLNINGKTNMNEFLPVFQNKLEREGIESGGRAEKLRHRRSRKVRKLRVRLKRRHPG